MKQEIHALRNLLTVTSVELELLRLQNVKTEGSKWPTRRG
jgi:hypothetical protein